MPAKKVNLRALNRYRVGRSDGTIPARGVPPHYKIMYLFHVYIQAWLFTRSRVALPE